MTDDPEIPQAVYGALMASGFPFQTAIERMAAQAESWELLAKEWPWRDEDGDGFLDLVISRMFLHLVIECKKTDKETFTFLQPGYIPQEYEARCAYLLKSGTTSPLKYRVWCADGDLLAQLERAAAQERQATAQLIALLMEVDARKLYAKQSCSSLFTYCVQVLHFSEHAAYLRIEAARTGRRFPVIVDRLADGSLHLTAVSLLGPHLTAANHVDVLDRATHKTKREVEQLLARLRPQPDVPAVVRKLPAPKPAVIPPAPLAIEASAVQESTQPTQCVAAIRPQIKPLAPERFKIQFTVSRDTYEKLRRVQDLLRHTIPNGDPAAIFDRALSLLLTDLSKVKFAAVSRPRSGHDARPGSRHIPAAIKREVWRRDGGQCAFRGERGRCGETGFLEFHHVVPFAKGGATTRENLELRCRTHNAYEAEQEFARAEHPLFARETRADYISNRERGLDRVPYLFI